MKIALINPKANIVINGKMKRFWDEVSPKLLRQSYSGVSLALTVLAALTPKSFKIRLIDENSEEIDFNEKYNLVAITAMTQQACRAYEIADIFRNQGNKVIIGGIHASSLPYEAKQHADSVAIGEAEEIWHNILKDIKNDKLESFYTATKATNLINSPLPRYDLLNHKYHNVIWIQTTRGCPIDCEFCAASKVFGLRLRHKSVEQVVREIKFIKKQEGPFQISFADDNMLIDRRYAISLLKSLKELNIRWLAQTDVSVAEDIGFLKLLRESGCVILFIGFESLTENSLASVDMFGFKLKRLKKFPFYIDKIQSLGIGILGAFVLGFDGDDLSIFDRTAEFIIKNHLYASQITVLTPLPGTRLRMRLEKEKRLLSNNWRNYTFWDVNFIPKQMSPQQLQDGLFEIHKRVYDTKVTSETMRYFKEIYNKGTK